MQIITNFSSPNQLFLTPPQPSETSHMKIKHMQNFPLFLLPFSPITPQKILANPAATRLPRVYEAIMLQSGDCSQKMTLFFPYLANDQ